MLTGVTASHRVHYAVPSRVRVFSMQHWGKCGRRGILFALSLGLLSLAQGAFARDTHDDPRSRLPARKPGLWEVTLHPHAAPSGHPQPSLTVQQCTDRMAERYMLVALAPAQENCSDIRVDMPTGQATGGYDIHLVCSAHGSRVETRIELTGDLQAVYSGSHVARQPGMPLAPSEPVNFQGRWLGPCRPDQRPGDMVLPNGIIVNVVDDVRRAEKHAH